jgi:hypothetical protein
VSIDGQTAYTYRNMTLALNDEYSNLYTLHPSDDYKERTGEYVWADREAYSALTREHSFYVDSYGTETSKVMNR